jgi:hypothetical protein
MANCADGERLDAVEIATVACTNLVPITRNRARPPLSGHHSLTQSDVAEIASWRLWPRAEGDLGYQKE